jgi:transposase
LVAWRISTFIAGLRNSGIIAPCVFNGAMDGELFLAYVEQQLAPALQEGDLLIADNLSSHNTKTHITDQNPCAQSRRPMDMTVQGCATSLFQA